MNNNDTERARERSRSWREELYTRMGDGEGFLEACTHSLEKRRPLGEPVAQARRQIADLLVLLCLVAPAIRHTGDDSGLPSSVADCYRRRLPDDETGWIRRRCWQHFLHDLHTGCADTPPACPLCPQEIEYAVGQGAHARHHLFNLLVARGISVETARLLVLKIIPNR